MNVTAVLHDGLLGGMQDTCLFTQKGNPSQSKAAITHLLIMANRWGFTGIANRSTNERLFMRSRDDSKQKQLDHQEGPKHQYVWRRTSYRRAPGALSLSPACRRHIFSAVQRVDLSPPQLFTSAWYRWEGALQNLLSFCSSRHVTLCLPPWSSQASPLLLELEGDVSIWNVAIPRKIALARSWCRTASVSVKKSVTWEHKDLSRGENTKGNYERVQYKKI